MLPTALPFPEQLEIRKLSLRPEEFRDWGWAVLGATGSIELGALHALPWWLTDDDPRPPRFVRAVDPAEAVRWARDRKLEHLVLYPANVRLSRKHYFHKYLLGLVRGGHPPAAISSDGVSFLTLRALPAELSGAALAALLAEAPPWPREIDFGGVEREDPRRVYYWNTESTRDLAQLPAGALARSFQLLASGTKPYSILLRAAHEDYGVTFYDQNPDALDFFRAQREQWDGEDYPAFIAWAQRALGTNRASDWRLTPAAEHERAWGEFLAETGETRWREFWRAYRRRPVSFRRLDLLAAPEALAEEDRGQPHLLWTSNIFNTLPVTRLGLSALRSLPRRTLGFLLSRPGAYWVGQDFFHRRFATEFSAATLSQLEGSFGASLAAGFDGQGGSA